MAMRNRLEEVSRRRRSRGVSVNVAMRAGINTGYCIGVFGIELLRDYTAIGTPIYVADRLKQQARPESIVCAFPTYVPFFRRDHAGGTPALRTKYGPGPQAPKKDVDRARSLQ